MFATNKYHYVEFNVCEYLPPKLLHRLMLLSMGMAYNDMLLCRWIIFIHGYADTICGEITI